MKAVRHSKRDVSVRMACMGHISSRLVYKLPSCCWQGRTTLLLGPPGAGKSVLLQLLAGHFKNSAFCRVTGDVKYNGKDKKEFVIQRTAGLVDQYDEHIANLTVHETLDFASACQVGKK